MGFCLVNVQLDHGRKVNELMNLVKGPIITEATVQRACEPLGFPRWSGRDTGRADIRE
jgi:hypothetical protein